MDNLVFPGTERSPEVNFDFAAHVLSIRGESYPEDAAAFFGPILHALDAFLSGLKGGRVQVDLELIYFNSSSAKALMNMFQLFENAAAAGNEIVVNWHYMAEDDTMQEFGEDFSEDLVHARFNLICNEAV